MQILYAKSCSVLTLSLPRNLPPPKHPGPVPAGGILRNVRIELHAERTRRKQLLRRTGLPKPERNGQQQYTGRGPRISRFGQAATGELR